MRPVWGHVELERHVQPLLVAGWAVGHAGPGLCRKASESIEAKQGWEPCEGQGTGGRKRTVSEADSNNLRPSLLQPHTSHPVLV